METILVLDDESTNLKVISLVLKLRGYNVLEASSGAEAIRICKSHHGPIHLLIAMSSCPTHLGLR